MIFNMIVMSKEIIAKFLLSHRDHNKALFLCCLHIKGWSGSVGLGFKTHLLKSETKTQGLDRDSTLGNRRLRKKMPR